MEDEIYSGRVEDKETHCNNYI